MSRNSRRRLGVLTAFAAGALSFTGTAHAAANGYPMNSCPPGYQLDPQNSQRCQPISTLAGDACTEGGGSGVRDNNGNCVRYDTGY
jgi:hypothetical protein